jgi:predicted phosphodiesterase
MKTILLVLVVGCSVVSNAMAQTEADGHDYQILFVSDLHMGVGRDPENPNEWHATEDFRWHAAFGDFLREMVNTARGDIDLVVLGDFLELWQSVDDDCNNQHVDLDLGCSEQEALSRTRRVLSQHAHVFEDLSWFALQANNSVTIVAGNHDVALAFASVRTEVMNAFSDQARGRVSIPTSAIWISPDGRIVAEHGQQIGADPNKFDGWPDEPFLEEDGVTYLVQPWGEHFVQELFNEVEAKYPVIDNLSEELRGVQYLDKGSSWGDKLKSVARALRFLFTQTSWDQTGQFLGPDGVPVWDLQAEAAKHDTDAKRWNLLVTSLKEGSGLRVALSNLTPPEDVPTFSDEELEAICDRRWALNKTDTASNIEPCERVGDELSMITQRIGDIVNPKARDKRFREYFKDLQSDGRIGNGFSVYVYGHTHKVEKYDPYDTSEGIIVYNDGAWQRTVTPEQLCSIAKAEGWPENEVLEKARPEDLPACYPFVTAVSRSDSPELRITNLFWVEKADGTRVVAASCTVAPEIHPACH